MKRVNLRDERGVMMVLFSVMLPLMLMLTAIAWDAGNWWIHRKHLQTKVDAAALAGATAWGFPCTASSDNNATETGIMDLARKYVGQHIEADGTSYTATTYNPQVGDTPGTKIHVVLNGSTWYDDDQGLNPADKSGQPNPASSICDSSFLDVKATERNNQPLFGWLPLAPDLKRKARVEIQEIEGLRGLLPIGVRVPKPVSAAAIFIDETPANFGHILGNGTAVKFFCETAVAGLPSELSGWSTFSSDPDCSYTSFGPGFGVPESAGIVIATSFRPRCGAPGATPPCFDGTGFATVDALCNQGTVQCFYATGSPQSVQSGLQFIHGYDASGNVTNGPPQVRSVWLDNASANCGAYFSSPGSGSCSMRLNANIDLGSVVQGTPPVETRTSANTEVRYKISFGTGNNDDICGNWTAGQCDVNPSWTASLTVPATNAKYSVAIRVRLKNTTVPGFPTCGNSGFNNNCAWFYTANGRTTSEPNNATIFANPIQRTFMGNINRSGAVKWLRLAADRGCNGNGVPDNIDGEAASQPFGQSPCFYVEMGLQGGLAQDQDEPPIALNLGDTSQRSLLDCDPNIPNLKDEVVTGCQDPEYQKNKFTTNPTCPGNSQFFTVPKAPPFGPPGGNPSDYYPPFRCVLTQATSAGNQLLSGFNERLFGVQNNPTCPQEDTNWPQTNPPTPAPWTKGRNYWHNDNNVIDEYTFADNGVPWGVADNDPSDNLQSRFHAGDPRVVNLFFTPYDSFTGQGNQVYPVAGFGTFYITGYGRINGGGLVIDDPCTDGNNGNLLDGNGSEPPPDLDYSSNTTYIWGHFVKEFVPPQNSTPSGVICNPSTFEPCVATLVH